MAEYSAKGMLRPITVPTASQEADRQLYRMRHRQALQLAKVKVQIKSFLLMHGISEPEGLKDWNKASVSKLRSMKLLDTLRLSLDEIQIMKNRRKIFIKKIKKTEIVFIWIGTIIRPRNA